VVPKGSATLDRYTSIGIHANHRNMVRFSDKKDPDYQNILSELRRFIQPCQQQPEQALLSAFSASSETQGQFHRETRDESSSAGKRDETITHERDNLYQPTKLVNNFSGSFHTGGGRIIQGNEFNSGGGPMTF
ncbi:MAG: hypothetical protein LQ338_006965, partial [Usnochroma carphineum]